MNEQLVRCFFFTLLWTRNTRRTDYEGETYSYGSERLLCKRWLRDACKRIASDFFFNMVKGPAADATVAPQP